MTFASVFKAFGVLMALREAVNRFSAPPPSPEHTLQTQPAAAQGFGGHLETRLVNVVVAALKGAFDRDHTRLELELRRQAVDRELARLRLLAGASIVGWIVSVVMVAAGRVGGSTPARVALAVGWMLILGALGAAFAAQARVGASLPDDDRSLDTAAAVAALSLLIAGLALTAVSLLL